MSARSITPMNHPGETELDPRDWWSTADVAAWCDVTQGTIRAYVVRGQMPAPVRIGRAMVWPAEQIRKWRPMPPAGR